MSSMRYAFDHLYQCDSFGFDWPRDGVRFSQPIIGPIRANTTLTRKYKEVSHEKFDENMEKLKNGTEYPFKRGELLFRILKDIFEQLIESQQFTYCYVHGPTTFGQVMRPEFEWELYTPYNQSRHNWIHQLYETPFLIYASTRAPENVKNMTVRQFLFKDFLISRLFRIAFRRILTPPDDCLTAEMKKLVLNG